MILQALSVWGMRDEDRHWCVSMKCDGCVNPASISKVEQTMEYVFPSFFLVRSDY